MAVLCYRYPSSINQRYLPVLFHLFLRYLHPQSSQEATPLMTIPNAPAGSMETFQAVIHAGADAVYLGGGRFGARAYANNFTEEELLLAIDYAHIHGRKVYLTVNTLFKEREFPKS